MRVLGPVFTVLALAGLLVGQPLCCALGDCCGRTPVEEARAPRGADAPCCPRCAVEREAADKEATEEEGRPAGPAPERCKCGVKKAHLTHVDVPGLDPVSLPAPAAHETVGAPIPIEWTAFAPERAPPRAAAGLTLPLLL